MKLLVALLVVANLAMAAYLVMRERAVDPDTQIVRQQLNADQIRTMTPRPPAPVAPSPPPVAAAPAPAPPAVCLEWSGLGATDVASAQAALDAMSLGDRLRKVDASSSAGYWVHMPPARTRAAMDKKAAELQERGVTNFATVLEAGRWRFAISLGWFRNEEGAKKYLATLRDKGVRSAQIIEREQKISQSTFFVRDPTDAQAKQLNELKSSYPASELRPVECPPA